MLHQGFIESVVVSLTIDEGYGYYIVVAALDFGALFEIGKYTF